MSVIPEHLNFLENQPDSLKSTLMPIKELHISAIIPTENASKYVDVDGYNATCRNCLIPLGIPNVDGNYAVCCCYCFYHMPILKAPRGTKYVRCYCERLILCSWETDFVICTYCDKTIWLDQNAILCSSLSDEPCRKPRCKCYQSEHLPKGSMQSSSYFPKAFQFSCCNTHCNHEFWMTWTQEYMKNCRCPMCFVLTSIPKEKQKFSRHKRFLIISIVIMLLVATVLEASYCVFQDRNIFFVFLIYATLIAMLYYFYVEFYYRRPNIIFQATKREFQKRYLL